MSIKDAIPENWRLNKLWQIAKVIMGQAPLGETYNREGVGVPLIAGASDLGDAFPKPQRWTSNPTQLCEPGDIIYCVRATIGEMNWADKEYCLGRGVAAIRPDEQFVVPEYLYYWLLTNKESFTRLGSGSTFIQIRRQDIEESTIPVPPKPEQSRIVSILRQADRLRQLRREAEEKAQQLLPALFYEMFGDPVTNPKGWSTTTVKNVSLRITDGTHQPPPFTESGIPFLFVSNIIDGEINLDTTKFISRKTYDSLMKRCPVERGDILYSTVGSYGVAVVVETDEPFAFQRHIAQIKPERTVIHPLFLRSMLNSSYVKAQVDQRVRGIAQGTLNLGEIAELCIFVPPTELQEVFADRVKIVQSVKARTSAVDQLLTTLFQSLLAQAFAGELTAQWREKHEELESIQGLLEVELTSPVEEKGLRVIEETVSKTIEKVPSRADIEAELSDEQQQLLDLINSTKGYCTVETLRVSCNLPVHAIRQGLQFLSQIGLIQSVRLPHRPIRNVVYVPVYRALDDGDLARTLDIGLLQQALQGEMA